MSIYLSAIEIRDEIWLIIPLGPLLGCLRFVCFHFEDLIGID